MIMQAVSLLSLNVLMLFFSTLFRSLAYAMNDQYYYLLTIVRTGHERISQLNKNERKRDEKKNIY
jgi:hypothetical protein